jgi:hypothetical protein
MLKRFSDEKIIGYEILFSSTGGEPYRLNGIKKRGGINMGG